MDEQDNTPGKETPEDEAQAEQEAAVDEGAGEEIQPAEATEETQPIEPEPEPEPEPAEKKSPEDEIAELKDKLLRALAENENTIRRARREREDTAKFAAANLARDVLTVADNLRRALDAIPDELCDDDSPAKGLVDGMQLTERELLATMERHGIKKIDPIGEKFDHNFHEAMFEVPTEDAEPGTVVQVIQPGYVIHERLLRAAQVGVAKSLPDFSEEHQVDQTV